MKQVKEKKKTVKPVEVEGRSVKAVLKFVRIAPRKARVVIDTIRYQHPSKAFDILMGLKKKAARIMEKLLKSVVANAKNVGMDETRLYISDVRADGGPMMKRFMERSMGRANRILKRTTHFQITLKEGQRKNNAPLELKEAKEIKENPKSEKKQAGRGKKKAAGASA